MQGEKGVILVTGSSGFIGAAAARRQARDYFVVGLDREGNPHPPPEADACGSICATMRALRRRSIECATPTASASLASFTSPPSTISRVLRATVRRDHRGRYSEPIESVTIVRRRAVHFLEHDAGECPVSAGRADQRRLSARAEVAVSAIQGHDRRAALARARLNADRCIRIAGVYDGRCHSIPLAQQIQRVRAPTDQPPVPWESVTSARSRRSHPRCICCAMAKRAASEINAMTNHPEQHAAMPGKGIKSIGGTRPSGGNTP